MASTNPRIHLYLKPEVFARLQAAKLKPGRPESDIVKRALAAFFSHEHEDKRHAALIRRLDRISRQIEGLERRQIIATEAFALFVRYFPTVIPQVAQADKKAAQAEGHSRLETYLNKPSSHSRRRRGHPVSPDGRSPCGCVRVLTKEELARLHDPAPTPPQLRKTRMSRRNLESLQRTQGILKTAMGDAIECALVLKFIHLILFPGASGDPASRTPQDPPGCGSTGTALRPWRCGARCSPRSPRRRRPDSRRPRSSAAAAPASRRTPRSKKRGIIYLNIFSWCIYYR